MTEGDQGMLGLDGSLSYFPKNSPSLGKRQKTVVRHWKTAEKKKVQFVSKGWKLSNGLAKKLDMEEKMITLVDNKHINPHAQKPATSQNNTHLNNINFLIYPTKSNVVYPEDTFQVVDKALQAQDLTLDPSKLEVVSNKEFMSSSLRLNKIDFEKSLNLSLNNREETNSSRKQLRAACTGSLGKMLEAKYEIMIHLIKVMKGLISLINVCSIHFYLFF